MFEISQSAAGLFAFVQQPRSKVERGVSLAWTRALELALIGYATGTLHGAKLKNRFEPWAYGAYGFSRRSSAYSKRQRKAFGVLAPYRSPRKMDLGPAAVALAELAAGRGQVASVLAALKWATNSAPPMSKAVTMPGGFRVRSTNGRRAKTTIAYPGARILNRIKNPQGGIYRKQFADLTKGGGRDLRVILATAHHLYREIMAVEIASIPRRRAA